MADVNEIWFREVRSRYKKLKFDYLILYETLQAQLVHALMNNRYNYKVRGGGGGFFKTKL